MNLQKNIYRRNNNELFESKNIIYIYFNNAIDYRNSFSNYFIGEIKMELTKRQKEVLEDVLWKECKELINLIHSGSDSVDKRYCSNYLKVVNNLLDKTLEEK